jgi:hypothetical protein
MICSEPQMPAALLIGSNSESFGSKLHATNKDVAFVNLAGRDTPDKVQFQYSQEFRGHHGSYHKDTFRHLEGSYSHGRLADLLNCV